jgi:hypothetical protein
MAVATGATPVSTHFDVPAAIEAGPSTLVVIANGIPSQPVNLTVNGLEVTPGNPSIAQGLTQQFTATMYSGGNPTGVTASVTWNSANPAVATITPAGVATGLAMGTSNITATLNGVTTPVDTLQVTAPALLSIAVTPASPSIVDGMTQQFTATGTYTAGSTQNITTSVTWNSATATVATIDSAGLAIGVGAGTSNITASLNGIPSPVSLLTVTPATLESIAVTPPSPSIAAGFTQQFTAIGTYSNSSTQNITASVTWNSATTTAATIDSAGLATGVGMGTSTITASLGGVTSPGDTLTVTAATLQSISITPANPSIAVGLRQQLTATGTYTDNSQQNLTSQVTWMSSNPSAAAVSTSGLAICMTAGTSTISATFNGITGSTLVTVTPAALQSIAVTPVNPSVAKGLTKQFMATGAYSDNSTQNLTSQVTWASATAGVATISTAGLAAAAGAGTSTISAALGAIVGSTVLTVTGAALVSIAVTPANPSIAKGSTQQFTATGTYTDSSQQNLTSQVTWASATASVATISTAGLATGMSGGASTISATFNGITGSTVLTVTAPTLVSIAVTPGNPSVANGLTLQFTATGTYTDNSQQNLTSQVTWTSSNQSTAAVSTSGLAITMSVGTSTISATLNGITGSTLLTVTTAALQSIAVTPANLSIAKGVGVQYTATGNYTDSSRQTLTSQVTWASGTTATATISSTGEATAVGVGTSTISATFNGITGSTLLTVTPPLLRTISVTPANPSISKGLTQQFAATGHLSDSSTQNLTTEVTWTGANASGLATGSSVGQTTVTATLGSVSGSTVLTVTAATLVSIAVTPANPSIVVGTTQQFQATGTYTDGSTQNLTSQVTWASTTTAAATITGAGKSAGVKVGASTIGAALGSVSGFTTLTITPLGPCDVTQQGQYAVVDAQAMINEALGVAPAFNDLNGDGVVNASDIQIAANAALGLGCTANSGNSLVASVK